MFEPFFTTKEQGKGSGLGLATVFGIVKQSGGNIWVYSDEGTGTTFKIYLPSVPNSVLASRPVKVEIEQSLSGTETILLVEDDEQVRALARRALQPQGYTLLEAQEGQTALHLATNHQGAIHLLLTDVIMPGMSGKTLAINLLEMRPILKVLYMSGYPDDTIVHHGLLEPGVQLVQKPFSALTLARKVRHVLNEPPFGGDEDK
jgi:CheY-like chemotaxis protein